MKYELYGGFVGEWWNADPEAVIAQALQTGGGPNVSDAYTINGLPGPLYNCSAKGSSSQGAFIEEFGRVLVMIFQVEQFVKFMHIV